MTAIPLIRPGRWCFLGFLIVGFNLDAVAQKAAPQLECAVTSSKRTRIEGGDYDDKTQKLSFDVSMTNKSMSKATGPLQATFYSFGECVNDRKVFKLLQKDTFDFELAPRGNFIHTTPQIELKYDTTGATFGEKHKGWILQIADGEGTMVFEQRSSAFIADMQNLPNLKVGDYCDKNLKTVGEPIKR